ncbi:MAG: flagellar biosynthesis anti-sigma factor FlgM [Sphingomonadaceae bacterium]|jgi:flagellar biosynthesis anti-sigma factor FlgM
MVDSVTSKPPILAGVGQNMASDIPKLRPKKVQNIQPVAHNISLASALAQNGPPFDAARIASLKEAIASGNYRIDLGAIADGIIRFGSKSPG